MIKRVALHFPLWAKLVLHGTLALSFLTGSCWFILHQWFQIEGEFGPEKHPLEPWLIQAHGASAFITLIGFGYLLSTHIHVAWRTKRNRVLGILLVANLVLLILSGWLLYYVGVETLRECISMAHLALGLALPITLFSHIRTAARRVPLASGK